MTNIVQAITMTSLPFVVATAFAQRESGTVNRTAMDHSGATVPGAEVTITDIGTNSSQIARAADHGAFHVATLKSSHYRLSVVASGFKESVVRNIELHTQDSLNEDVVLAVSMPAIKYR